MDVPTVDLKRSAPWYYNVPNTLFGVSLGVGAQALLARAVFQRGFPWPGEWVEFPGGLLKVIWTLAAVVFALVLALYLYRCYKIPGSWVSEVRDPMRSNFLFAPMLVALFLAIGVHEDWEVRSMQQAVFVGSLVYQTLLGFYLYMQWLVSPRFSLFTKGRVEYLMSVVGWFVIAVLGTRLEFTDWASLSWQVGLFWLFIVYVAIWMCHFRNSRYPEGPYTPESRGMPKAGFSARILGLNYRLNTGAVSENSCALQASTDQTNPSVSVSDDRKGARIELLKEERRIPAQVEVPLFKVAPILYLSVAPPSVAATSWAQLRSIALQDGYSAPSSPLAEFVSTLVYPDLSLFLFAIGLSMYIIVTSLCITTAVQRWATTSQFHLGWWAYTFPATALAIASIFYSRLSCGVSEAPLCDGTGTRVFSFVTCCFSFVPFLCIFLITLWHVCGCATRALERLTFDSLIVSQRSLSGDAEMELQTRSP